MSGQECSQNEHLGQPYPFLSLSSPVPSGVAGALTAPVSCITKPQDSPNFPLGASQEKSLSEFMKAVTSMVLGLWGSFLSLPLQEAPSNIIHTAAFDENRFCLDEDITGWKQRFS